MVIAGDIGSLIDFFSCKQLPWQSCKSKEVYQTAYITSNYHGNAVKLKKSIRLPISQAITMAML
jgi:GTP-dependent phosphoenolpyruvate carboxykinase